VIEKILWRLFPHTLHKVKCEAMALGATKIIMVVETHSTHTPWTRMSQYLMELRDWMWDYGDPRGTHPQPKFSFREMGEEYRPEDGQILVVEGPK
jgi:hypothetical protein